jgi:hypothetical protein
MQLPPVTGVNVRYIGNAGLGTTTWYYWVQAIYPDGLAQLSSPGNTGAKAPASFSSGNFAQVQWNPMPGAIGYLVWRSTSSTLPQTGGTQLAMAFTSETGIKDDGSFSTTTTSPRYDGLYVAKAIWDFATDGGAISTITPALSDTIPANAIVCGGLLNSVIAPVGASGTISVGTKAGSGAATILAATAITAMTLDAVIELLGTNSQAATQKPSFKMTAAGAITITIATTAMTAGRLEIFVFYVVASNS